MDIFSVLTAYLPDTSKLFEMTGAIMIDSVKL